MPNYRKCEICGLRTERKNGQKRIFMAKFPLNAERCKLWVKFTGNEDLAYLPIDKLHKKKYLCRNHFTIKDFTRSKAQLKRTAVPSINLTAEPLSDEILKEFSILNWGGTSPTAQLDGIAEQQTRQKAGSIPLHRFPNPDHNIERFQTWLYAIGGDILSLENQFIFKYRRVCHKHFEVQFTTIGKRLSNIAVPTLQLSSIWMPLVVET